MFEHSTYTTGHVVDPAGRSVRDLQRRHHRGGESAGRAVRRDRPRDRAEGQPGRRDLAAIGAAVVRAVERYTDSHKFADDLTILLLRRCTTPAPAAVSRRFRSVWLWVRRGRLRAARRTHGSAPTNAGCARRECEPVRLAFEPADDDRNRQSDAEHDDQQADDASRQRRSTAPPRDRRERHARRSS